MPTASQLGLGAMRLSELEESAALRLIYEALDRGIRFFDTADVYAPSADEIGHNERLLAKAFGRRSEEVTVATKGGLRREGKQWIPDGRAKHLKAACEASLRALDIDCIDLYQLHAVDAKVPLATSMRALASLKKDGKIRRVGLCNVRREDVEAARDVCEVDSVQVALSPLDMTALKNGVVAYCVRNSIPLVAHSPLGGHRRVKRLRKLEPFKTIAARHGVSALEIALAWLLRVDGSILTIPGATQVESIVSSRHALDIELSEDELTALDDAFAAGAVVRSPPPVLRVDESNEVVVLVGYPGAGKSTLATSWTERGYVRLSRDERGGRLDDLLPELDRLLRSGERRILLDNTYPRRASRFDVIATARRHGVGARCVWLETSLEQAQVNAVRRMIQRHDRLLDPIEMAASEHANDVTPEALFRYRRELEPPIEEEGFGVIEKVPFVPEDAGGSNRAVFVGELSDASELSRYTSDGYRIVQLLYRPGDDAAEVDGTVELSGVTVERFVCRHRAGRTSCWCRKPLPGHGVLAIERFELDPSACIVVGDSAADRGFAERLGMRRLTSHELGRNL